MAEPMYVGDTSPEYGEVIILRKGEPVTLKAYVSGKRCPGSIKAIVSDARKEYNTITQLGEFEPVLDPATDEPMVDELGQPVLRDLFHPDATAWYRMLRAVLGAVVLDLSIDEADVISGDDDQALEILRNLGWWPKAPAEVTTAGETKGRRRKTTSGRSSRN